jgi:ribonucleotide reductase alpha subunit
MARGGELEMDRGATRTWTIVREMLRRHGLRHCHTTALASTAEISALAGVSDGVEPAKEINAAWLVECASRRQKWIDSGQALALAADPDPASISNLSLLAWRKGLPAGCVARGQEMVHQVREEAMLETV